MKVTETHTTPDTEEPESDIWRYNIYKAFSESRQAGGEIIYGKLFQEVNC